MIYGYLFWKLVYMGKQSWFSQNIITAGFQSADDKRFKKHMQTFSVNFYGFSSLFHRIIIYLFLLGYKNNANYIYLVYDRSIFFICIDIAVIV